MRPFIKQKQHCLLEGHRNPPEKVCSWLRFLSRNSNAVSIVWNEVHGLLLKHTQSLYGNWCEMMSHCNGDVLSPLLPCPSQCCNCSCLVSVAYDMRGSTIVWQVMSQTNEQPTFQEATVTPLGHLPQSLYIPEGSTVEDISAVAKDLWVVDYNGCTAGMATSTLNTTKTMHAQLIHFSMAMLAAVQKTNGCTQTQSSGNFSDIIIHPEADRANEKGLQPCPRLPSGSC